ncbi:unnamed protein product [Nezara viridula]|uniref:C2H2-type domain-containing protein n=1 Tax=Nezara viridula TaxID=85310 RepID=A0A9P0H6V3_NEZVI|nr:unnamed protein product [Nezara viridula]
MESYEMVIVEVEEDPRTPSPVKAICDEDKPWPRRKSIWDSSPRQDTTSISKSDQVYLRQLWLRRQADAPRLTGAFEETPLIRHPGGSIRDRMRPKRLFSECNKECEGFQCNPCGLVFANADALSTHLDFHTRFFNKK